MEVVYEVFKRKITHLVIVGGYFTLALNTKNSFIVVQRCHVDSFKASLVHPSEVSKPAILNNVASVIVANQHPSGDITPSLEDINVLKILVEAGKLLGIEVLVHLVVSNNNNFY
ncbi:JAB domain-containing protein [Halobacillus hunanensis]|uniref:JAB domain-containing protein n=1 Tax=Halobacillus hunanensis TaxID=578214 RepID=UPI0011169DCB|nr:JAB domain-containing protein [Halobacillus hunanensis]